MEDLPFRDRTEAGQCLSRKLAAYADRTDVIVLALPRGGVPVGYEVAKALRVPLDVFLVRKLGAPGQEELAMGAIAMGGVRVVNDEVVRLLHIEPQVIDSVAAKEAEELARRNRLYRGTRPQPDVKGNTVILVDDGLATGSSMRAAVAALRLQGPKRIMVAVPVAAVQTFRELSGEVDEVVCCYTPEPFFSVGFWYEDFSQTPDNEIREWLDRAARDPAPTA
ncbi:MAG: phosphoribosyltransferase [Acidobacteriia bacterium]|nr:phosphoribosyltransferase [Terriglobia bacterium]